VTRSPVGDILLKAGLLDEQGLARVLEIQDRDGGTPGKIVARLGLADEGAVARAIAQGLGLPFDALDSDPESVEPTDVLPPEFCWKRMVVPLGSDARSLRLAMANPLDQSTLQDVEFRSDRWVRAVVSTETAIVRLLKRLHPEADPANRSYDLLAEVSPVGVLEAADESYEVVDPNRLSKEVALPPIVRLVNLILTDAAKAGASDVHVEPEEQRLQVRHRVDGILHDVLAVPKHLQQSVVSRLKIISGMDIAERRKPQDGRSRLRIDERRIDLRVSSLPTQHGEKVVIRLLDSANAGIEMAQLGLAADVQRTFQELLSRPQGMILVTGPTGSGKTSTLYASLNWVKSRATNIITVEDPIEYQMTGVSQVQINTRAGVTFAAGLRSILRQDPDIVLVGEIRDQETADIALEAAQTGHLLLSTMHTNDAPSSVTRLLDLGIEPFVVASSIIGILAQRLVRRVCPGCGVEREPAAETLARIGEASPIPATPRWRSGQGCEACHQSGFRGRIGIHELLVVDDDVRERITRHAADHQIREAARRAGMRTLFEDGLAKAAAGQTTIEEVLRVAPPGNAERRSAGSTTVSPGPAGLGPTATTPAAAVGPAGAPQAGGRKDRVLIVEDSPTVVTVVKYFLELEGFEVLVAEDGQIGLEMALREMPDVVVSDLNMPGMDGLSMIRAIRQDDRTRNAGIIMLTSEASVDAETEGLAVGADDYIAKPVEPRRLAARVKAVLARARGRMAAAA